MAIGRISGPMLKSNLERQGVDLSVETNLLYLDVNNNRIGINNNLPTVDFDLSGVALFDSNLKINGTTISSENVNGNITVDLNGSGTLNISNLTSGRLVYTGTDGAIIDTSNLTFNGSSLSVTGEASIDNININGNTISSTDTNGDIVLSPDGSGAVNVSYLTSGRVVLAGTSGTIEDSANLTFDGTTLTVSGNIAVDNVTVDGNTIDTSAGNLSLDSAGGEVTASSLAVSDLTSGRVVLAGTSGAIQDSANLTFSSNSLSVTGNVVVDNITIDGNSISSTNTNGNIVLSPDGTGRINLDTVASIVMPIGNTSQRPTAINGDFRYNSDTNTLEYYNGTNWNSLVTTAEVGAAFFEDFSGDGSTTDFELSNSTTTTDTIITLNGLIQSPGNAYTVSGTTVSFTEAPKTGDAIEVRYRVSTLSVNAAIADNDTNIVVNDGSANIVGKINNVTQFTIDSSSATFTGSIVGTGSISSILTSVPSSSSDTGTKGQIAYDASYVYICVATDTWIRASIQNSF